MVIPEWIGVNTPVRNTDEPPLFGCWCGWCGTWQRLQTLEGIGRKLGPGDDNLLHGTHLNSPGVDRWLTFLIVRTNMGIHSICNSRQAICHKAMKNTIPLGLLMLTHPPNIKYPLETMGLVGDLHLFGTTTHNLDHVNQNGKNQHVSAPFSAPFSAPIKAHPKALPRLSDIGWTWRCLETS